MDKKELLKRWALAYTEPSLFYVPCTKKEEVTYIVTFLRYANIHYSHDNTYMISDEIYTDKTASYYIYDEYGNYYNIRGEKSTTEKPLLYANFIRLPKGQYYYKEMVSLYGCRLIEQVIPFTVTQNQNIVLHHQANMLTINYDIELVDYELTENNIYTTEQTERRLNSGAVGWYTAEHIEDIQRIPNGINIGVPTIKIQKINTYKKDYSNEVSLTVELLDTQELDYTLAVKSNAEFILPSTPESYQLTYALQKIESLSKVKTLFYRINVNGDICDEDLSLGTWSYMIRNISERYSTHGTIYNKYIDTKISWYYNPSSGNVLDWKYEAYKAKTMEFSGFDGQTGKSEIVGKNTVLFTAIKESQYIKWTDTEVSPETGKKTIKTAETPSTSNISTIEVDNFNEITILSELIRRLTDKYNLGYTCGIHLYKTQGTSLTCYGGGAVIDSFETRYLLNGNDVANKDADSIFVGALIAKEERQEESGGET